MSLSSWAFPTPTSDLTPLGHHRTPDWAPCVIQQLLAYPLTHNSVGVDATFSLCPIHSLPHCVYKSVPFICISGGLGYMYSYDRFMLLYRRNQYNIVKIQKKKKSHKNTMKQCQWNDDRSPPPLHYCGSGLVAKLCPTLVTPWIVARQVPLSMGFSRQEYWNGLPCPPPGALPDPRIKPRSPALQVDFLSTELWGKTLHYHHDI